MNKAIVYCRVSSMDQVSGTSLDRQEEACREYARAKNLEVAEVFVEKGESATAANRTELLRTLDYCREHKGEIVAFIVWKLDRFARNTTDHYGLQAQLIKYGTSLHSVMEPMISDGPVGKVLEAVLAGFAQFENDTRKQRCEGGMQKKIKEGIWPWWPPIGYIHSKNFRTDRRKTVPDLVDTDRFELIQKGLKAYARGEYTITSLTDAFNEWGLKTRTGIPIFTQMVEKMLKNKYYAGVLIDPWSGEEHLGLHKPMITREEHATIQLIKSGKTNNAIAPRRRVRDDFPLRGVARCSCGGRLTASWQTGHTKNKYGYYHCYNRSCAFYGHAIAKKELEDGFTSYLTKLKPSQVFLRVFKATVLVEWQTGNLHAKKERIGYEQELATLEEKRNRLLEMRLANELGQEDFVAMKNRLDDQIATSKVSRNEAETTELDLEAAINTAIHFVQNVARLWQELKTAEAKQRTLKLVLPEGVTYDRDTKSFGTRVLSPIYSLSASYTGRKSDFVAGAGFEPATFRF